MSERVYVISAGPTMQKVGIADDPRGRLLGMQTGCPLALHLVLSLETPVARLVEQDVHLMFREYRIRGEWFDVGPIAAVQAVCMAVLEREHPGRRPSPCGVGSELEVDDEDGML